MKSINDLHETAMDFADQAFIARRKGDFETANSLSRKAYEQESKAAEYLQDDYNAEPSRSVLYRSAASLAMECGETREAERLISIALSGNPPNEIAEELRNLLEQVNFERHLRLEKVDLSPDQFQLSIFGREVGYGIALSEVLIERIKDIERLIYRTVERKMGRQFREHGATSQTIQNSYSLYLSAPRPGSFAITLILGRQMELPGFDFDISGEVVDEIIDGFNLINNGREEELRKKIPDETYFQNFIGLAKRIAPDGDKVKMVGLTKLRDGHEVRVSFTRKQEQIVTTLKTSLSDEEEKGVLVRVQGRLLLADARESKRKIQLIDEDSTKYDVNVPEGMMDDIVKPLWDEIVIVTGNKVGKKINLREITKA
jgi:RNase P/RNase MRP subunit p29